MCFSEVWKLELTRHKENPNNNLLRIIFIPANWFKF